VRPGEIDEITEGCLAEGRARWPAVTASDASLRPLIRARVEAVPPRPGWSAELFIAVAASQGDPMAAQWLHERVMTIASLAIKRIVPPAEIDEVAQHVSVMLLVGSGGPPRIDSYRAGGPLDRWLRTIIVREALAMRHKHANRSRRSYDETSWLQLPMFMDHTVAATWQRYAPLLRASFEAALAELPIRSRVALRQHFVDGLSADEIARMYGVHRVTAYRWIAEAKLAILTRVRGELSAQLDSTPSEIDSLLRSVRSQFSITLDRLLASEPDVPR
jgi:RNA polymerase sigma-70 factor (ECF subfamily)